MRRALSFLGVLAVVALVLLLLWSVYLHHAAAARYTDHETRIVDAKIAHALA